MNEQSKIHLSKTFNIDISDIYYEVVGLIHELTLPDKQREKALQRVKQIFEDI